MRVYKEGLDHSLGNYVVLATAGALRKANSEQEHMRKYKRIMRETRVKNLNVFILGLGFLLTFTAFNTTTNLQVSYTGPTYGLQSLVFNPS